MDAKCLIVYASMTGNTRMMAKAIAAGLTEAGFQADIGATSWTVI